MKHNNGLECPEKYELYVRYVYVRLKFNLHLCVRIYGLDVIIKKYVRSIILNKRSNISQICIKGIRFIIEDHT